MEETTPSSQELNNPEFRVKIMEQLQNLPPTIFTLQFPISDPLFPMLHALHIAQKDELVTRDLLVAFNDRENQMVVSQKEFFIDRVVSVVMEEFKKTLKPHTIRLEFGLNVLHELNRALMKNQLVLGTMNLHTNWAVIDTLRSQNLPENLLDYHPMYVVLPNFVGVVLRFGKKITRENYETKSDAKYDNILSQTKLHLHKIYITTNPKNVIRLHYKNVSPTLWTDETLYEMFPLPERLSLVDRSSYYEGLIDS